MSGSNGVPIARVERSEQLDDMGLDVFADRADNLERLICRVGDLPVLIALARIDRAGVAATHRDDHISGLHDDVGQRLGELVADIDTRPRSSPRSPPGRSAAPGCEPR